MDVYIMSIGPQNRYNDGTEVEMWNHSIRSLHRGWNGPWPRSV